MTASLETAESGSPCTTADDPQPSVLLIGDTPEIGNRTTSHHALTACGARLQDHLSWTEAGKRLAQHAGYHVILAETSGVADSVLEAVLPVLADLAEQREANVIVVLDRSQIDLVAGAIGSASVDLLCSPSVAECIGSLCVAFSPANTRVRDVGGTPESARLIRLNEEIVRIAETLTRLTRGEDEPVRSGLGSSGSVAEGNISYRAQAPIVRSDIQGRDVRDTIRARRLRDQFLGAGLFEDPAWDMLLDLFAAELEHAQVSVSSLCIAAAVAPTTALRWIARLTEAGLFERRPDPFDRRRAFMALSASASLAMRNYMMVARNVG